MGPGHDGGEGAWGPACQVANLISQGQGVGSWELKLTTWSPMDPPSLRRFCCGFHKPFLWRDWSGATCSFTRTSLFLWFPTRTWRGLPLAAPPGATCSGFDMKRSHFSARGVPPLNGPGEPPFFQIAFLPGICLSWFGNCWHFSVVITGTPRGNQKCRPLNACCIFLPWFIFHRVFAKTLPVKHLPRIFLLCCFLTLAFVTSCFGVSWWFHWNWIGLVSWGVVQSERGFFKLWGALWRWVA